MKRALLPLVLVVLCLLALTLTASAVDPVVPTVTAVEPASAFNDIDMNVTITGADFLAGVDGTVTVALGNKTLPVSWVDSSTLTAAIPSSWTTTTTGWPTS